MSDIRGIVVCVKYDDLLSITLPRNMRHLKECLVITHPSDEKTKDVCRGVPGVRVYETTAFYDYGAAFNKGLAMEQGFNVLGREGWILIWDADIVLPDKPDFSCLQPNRLHGSLRFILDDPKQFRDGFNWNSLRLHRDRPICGYHQLFHAQDPHAVKAYEEKGYWYDPTFRHAGGCDGFFESCWDRTEHVWMPYRVLHLGPHDQNWHGRWTPRMDEEEIEDSDKLRKRQHDYHNYKGWLGAKGIQEYGGFRPELRTIKQYDEHVIVPGYVPSGYKVAGT